MLVACSTKKYEFNHGIRAGDYKKAIVKIPTKYDTLKNIAAYPANAVTPFTVSFTKVATFGLTPYYDLNNRNFAIDNAGRVYMDAGGKIAVFDSTGTYLKNLGRKGRGPGEFDNMVALKPKIKDHKLYAYDDILHRINVYSTDSLTNINTIYLNPVKWEDILELRGTRIRNFCPLNDSLLLLAFEDYAIHKKSNKNIFVKYYRLNHKGEVVSNEIFKFKMNPDNTPAIVTKKRKFFPFHSADVRYMRVKFDKNNYIYTSRTGDFLIKIYSPMGKYLRTIYYPYKNSPLNKKKIIDMYKYNPTLFKRAKKHHFPATWPAIDRFFLDDKSRIWVATITKEEDYYEWWVLQSNGKLIAKFKWPGNRLKRGSRFRVSPKVKNGFWYAWKTDSTAGRGYLVKYKFHFKKIR
jgi:hypothetical protein